MGLLDWLKEIPLSVVQKEQIALLERQFSDSERKLAIAEKKIASLEEEKESLETRLGEAQIQIGELQAEAYKTQEPPPEPDEIEIKILLDLFQHEPLQHTDDFLRWLRAGGMDVKEGHIKSRLRRLRDRGFIRHVPKRGPKSYELTQEGREYVENNLLQPQEDTRP